MKKHTVVYIALATLFSITGCKKFLDVNDNPNGPTAISAVTYLAPIQAAMADGIALDAVYYGRYTQNWVSTSNVPALTVWDRQGYTPVSDNGSQLWRQVYWKFGMNLEDLINLSLVEQRWDLAGIGYAIKAWGWQNLTDVHGEITISQAYEPGRSKFDYDTQEFAYKKVQDLTDSALHFLGQTNGLVSKAYTAKGDQIYKGDVAKWIKFVYGLKAINMHHLAKKLSYYDQNLLLDYINNSLASEDDNTLVPYSASITDDSSPLGATRNNLSSLAQSEYIVSLLQNSADSTANDPRLHALLVPDSLGNYRGLKPGIGAFEDNGDAMLTNKKPFTLWGTQIRELGQGKYIFHDRAPFPLMTYAQLQFIKAETLFHRGSQDAAHQAYSAGVKAHFEFVSKNKNSDKVQDIPLSQVDAFIQNLPKPGDLTIADIMTQKYIAQFGWGFIETWTDLRKYNYGQDGAPAFKGFKLPVLYQDNGVQTVQRVRPRYNSEYVWNIEALQKLGADKPDYHTKPLWIME